MAQPLDDDASLELPRPTVATPRSRWWGMVDGVNTALRDFRMSRTSTDPISCGKRGDASLPLLSVDTSGDTSRRLSWRAMVSDVGSAFRELSEGRTSGLSSAASRDHGPGSPCTSRSKDFGSQPGYFGQDSVMSHEQYLRRCGRLSPGPASRFESENPLLNSTRPRRQNTVFVPMMGAASEAFSYPHYPDCAHCGLLLSSKESRWGTGLCDGCYADCPKNCRICNQMVTLKQLRWYSGLCNKCYDACEKDCHFCHDRLRFDQLHWRSGLCDKCYDASDKICRLCSLQLDMRPTGGSTLHWRSGLCDPCYDNLKQEDKTCRKCDLPLAPESLRWGTGLCDACFDSSEKDCRICSEMLEFHQLRWQSGLCDSCYDTVEKECLKCRCILALGQLHWRSGLCDKCYDQSEKVCKSCKAILAVGVLHWGSGLCDQCYGQCDKTCQVCKERINDGQLHWGTGLCDTCWSTSAKRCVMCDAGLSLGDQHWGTNLCDKCYDASEKTCKLCEGRVQLGSLRWGTGLCDGCYNGCDKTCKTCEKPIGLGHLRWGTGLCNSCYDDCDKICRTCQTKMPFGQLRWATGICDRCYDRAHSDAHSDQKSDEGLDPSIWTAIIVQLVFYMAPALLQPALFLEISDMYDNNAAGASAAYAFVLTTASVVSMIAPIPFGLWAERRGEREVYVGITAIAGFSGILLAYVTEADGVIFFALAWGALNAPPAIRGVRAVHFAKNVKPQDLSRAGQLASSAGLLGSVLGPIAANVIHRFCNAGSIWVSGFQSCALLATLAHCGSAAALQVMLPAPVKKGMGSGSGSGSGGKASSVVCTECEKVLVGEESRYQTYLCTTCYDNYRGTETSFERFKWVVLLSFCTVAGLLELSMNAGVLATFQPIAVTQLGWRSTDICNVNLLSALISVVVSIASAQAQLPEKCQVLTAAGFYCAGVILFTMPPVSNFSCIAGLVLSLKAQILFMAPFTSIFSRLIGRTRVTNRLTISLCLAPAVGGACGTVLSPLSLSVVNTVWFMMSAVPAVLAFISILLFRNGFDGSW